MRERVCNNCGGREYKVVGQNMVKCMFCGTLYVDEHASKEEEVLLVGAYEILRDKNFDGAAAEFDKILELYPMSFEAYFGKALAENKIILYNKRGVRKIPRFYGDMISLADDKNFKKAIELAPEETKHSYQDIAIRINKIKKAYEEKASKLNYDVFVCTENAEIQQKIEEELKKFSFYFLPEKDKEENTYQAFKTCKAFVFFAESEENDCKIFYEHYLNLILRKQKAPTSLIVVYKDKKFIPKELTFCKSMLDLNSVSFMQDFEVMLENESKKTVGQAAKIETVKVEKVEPVKKEYVDIETINPVELGNYNVENLNLNLGTKQKWIFLSLKNEDFDTAKELIDEALQQDPYNSEILFAKLLCDKKIKTKDDFFENISNFKDKESIDNILRYANKDFAEYFVNKWEDLVIKLGSVEFYNTYLLYLAGFNSQNRENLISHAENMAIESMDEELIEKVLKCFKKEDTERFVHFYFLLAQKSDSEKYYNKILEIDQGHEQSNFSKLLKHYKTPKDVLTYRNKEELEETFKFLDANARADFVTAFLDLLLPVAFIDLENAQQQLDFYLAYIEDENRLNAALKTIAHRLQQMGFFTAAEKYLSILISKDKENCENYWDLILIKAHCKNDNELITTDVKISKFPEWNTLLELGDNAHDELYTSILSKSNLYKGKKKKISDENIDRSVLKSKLSEFLLRNQKVLLEIEKQNPNSTKGIEYFKSQLEPFEMYVAKMDNIDTFEEYVEFCKRVQERLNMLDLSLDSSVSAIAVAEKGEGLKKYEKPSTTQQNHEKQVKNIKKDVFLKKFLMIFLELVPMLFATLLLVICIAAPKDVYLYFSQDFLIGMICVCVAIAVGNFIFLLLRQKKLVKGTQLFVSTVVCIGFLNLFFFLFAFYITPEVMVLNNAKEMQILLSNAKYANFTLGQDIDLSGGWKSVDFFGTLDGNGHMLSNVKLSNSGFFATNNGDVKNINFEFAKQTITNPTMFGAVAQQNFGTLENVVVSGTIEIITNADATISGMVAANNGGKIVSCENRLVITINAIKNLTFGGIVGRASGNSTFYQNKNEVQLTLNMNDGKEVVVGGMIGELKRASGMNFSQNANEIDMAISGAAENSLVGGLVGVGRSANSNNYCSGKIDVSTFTSTGYVGGLFGFYQNSNRSETIGYSYTAIEYIGEMKYGSLVGQLGGVVEYSFGKGECVAETLSDFATARHCPNTEEFYPAEVNFSTEIWKITEDAYPKFIWERE